MTPRAFVIHAAVLFSLACLAAWVGYRVGHADVAALSAAHDRALFHAAERASQTLYAAQQHGDALTTELQQLRSQHQQLSKERRHALSTVTDQSVCLRSNALRVLNHAPGLSVSVPAPTGEPAAADAEHAATNTQLASWALDAGAQYAECAARLDTLIRWHREARP